MNLLMKHVNRKFGVSDESKLSDKQKEEITGLLDKLMRTEDEKFDKEAPKVLRQLKQIEKSAQKK